MQTLFLLLASGVYCPCSVSTEATLASTALHACVSERLRFTREKTRATNPLHPAVAMSVSLNPGLFLWAWSLDVHDMQDTVEIWALNVYSEKGTYGPKPYKCLDNSALNKQRLQQAV